MKRTIERKAQAGGRRTHHTVHHRRYFGTRCLDCAQFHFLSFGLCFHEQGSEWHKVCGLSHASNRCTHAHCTHVLHSVKTSRNAQGVAELMWKASNLVQGIGHSALVKVLNISTAWETDCLVKGQICSGYVRQPRQCALMEACLWRQCHRHCYGILDFGSGHLESISSEQRWHLYQTKKRDESVACVRQKQNGLVFFLKND